MPPFNASSWKELTERYARDATFGRPASESQLAAVEQALGIRLPDSLREFLLEADGVSADYGSGVIWSAADILNRNLEFRAEPGFRSLYMSFDQLLFFGDDGCGDQVAFAIQADGQIHRDDVFRWEHESDARSWFAGRLEQYLETRLHEDA
jgi:hypothetical protein